MNPTSVKCPICQSECLWTGNPYRPFCSERCRLIDLGAWAEGKYSIPVSDLDDESESIPDEDE